MVRARQWALARLCRVMRVRRPGRQIPCREDRAGLVRRQGGCEIAQIGQDDVVRAQPPLVQNVENRREVRQVRFLWEFEVVQHRNAVERAPALEADPHEAFDCIAELRAGWLSLRSPVEVLAHAPVGVLVNKVAQPDPAEVRQVVLGFPPKHVDVGGRLYVLAAALDLDAGRVDVFPPEHSDLADRIDVVPEQVDLVD